MDLNYNSLGNTGWYTESSPWNFTPPTYGDTETPGGYTEFDWGKYAIDPNFLKRIGFSGDAYTSDGYGDSGGNFSLNPAYLDAIKNSGYEMRQMTGQDWNGTLSSLFKNGREVPGFRQVSSYDEGPEWNLGTSLATAALAPGGFIGGASTGIGAGLGFSGAAAQGLTGAFNSGMIGAGSGAKDRDVVTNMALSGGAPFLPNLGEMVGIENPYLAQAFDGGVKGAGIADLTDGDVKTGATVGAIPGLASYAGARFSDTSLVPTTSGRNLINETRQASTIPSQSSFPFTESAPMTNAPNYVAQGSPLAFDAPQKSGGFELPELNDFFGKLMPSSPQGWGNFAQGLAGMFLGGMQYNKARKLEKEMTGRRGAYESNLRNQLSRRDAASGRRSNYAGRETQLQAALAELDSRNMPARASLQNSQFQGLGNMFTSGLRYAGKQGVFGDLNAQTNVNPNSYLMSTMPQPQSNDVYNTSWLDSARLGDSYLARRNKLGGM